MQRIWMKFTYQIHNFQSILVHFVYISLAHNMYELHINQKKKKRALKTTGGWECLAEGSVAVEKWWLLKAKIWDLKAFRFELLTAIQNNKLSHNQNLYIEKNKN